MRQTITLRGGMASVSHLPACWELHRRSPAPCRGAPTVTSTPAQTIYDWASNGWVQSVCGSLIAAIIIIVGKLLFAKRYKFQHVVISMVVATLTFVFGNFLGAN
jgi:hypothetical protein